MNFGIYGPFREIAMGVQMIEHAVVVVAGLLALAWLACNWTDA